MLQENIEDEIVEWMQEQVAKRDADGALVGLSGGVDSSTVAGLIKRAFGDDSLGVLLPCSGTVSKDVEYAEMVADEFDLETISVNLKEAYEGIEETFTDIDVEEVDREYWPQTKVPTINPAQQNIITRLRMMTLYYIAEKMNYVVMGTSNQSEIITGYYTLYGDGATDMRPLGDLTKMEVWELAKRIGVPQEIVDRPPTGGLRGEDTEGDEEEFGINYEQLDAIYEAMENGEDLDQFDQDDVARVKELVTAAKDKEKIPTFTR
ncbi:MAG: NAD(+) synthase [Bacillota bacterium]